MTNWMMSELDDVIEKRRYMLPYDSKLTKQITLLLNRKMITMVPPETPWSNKEFVPTFKGLWANYLWESKLVSKDSQIFK